MTEGQKTPIRLILLAISLIISCLIIFYFWFVHKDFTRKIELWVMILAFAYLAVEMVKKGLNATFSQWNRLYYLGLLGVIAPIALEHKTGTETIRWINHIGVLFLLAPFALEASALFKAKQT